MASSPRIPIRTVIDPALMTSVWKKRLRSRLRKQRLQDFQLGHDPLEWLAFDWDLASALATLGQDVANGTYRASAPEIVRSAKGKGLTRPLAFLRPPDLVLYKTIVALAENSLLQASKPWTRFGRNDEGENDNGGTLAESGWFRNWLRRQGQIWTITNNHPWLIETDVANFFPYVDGDLVVEHLLSNSKLSEDVIRLLSHMLRQFSPMTEYRRPTIVGLPQEDFDCSRILGHTYLKPVDDEFDEEGRDERYSRYMDDVVIGADDMGQALRSVLRVQQAFERLGLYPNTAKTRIVPADDLVADYMKAENDYLGVVDGQLEEHVAVDVHVFRSHLRRHIRPGATRPKAWSQVLRRYYSISRHMESGALLRLAFDHVALAPDSARHIFDYLASFPITRNRFHGLCRLIEQLGGVYEDVDLLAHEYLCSAPNRVRRTLRHEIGSWAWSQLQATVVRRPRLAASACMTLGKFGTPSQLDELRLAFDRHLNADTVLRQQAIVTLAGAGRLAAQDVSALSHVLDPVSAQHIRYLSALMTGEDRAVKMALSLVEPIQRRYPDRWIIRPRALFLAPLAAHASPRAWGAVSARWFAKVSSNRNSLRDCESERWITTASK